MTDTETISFDPLPQEQYFAIQSERERALQGIGDVIGYWLKWVTREHGAEDIPVTPDTHIWNNGYDGCPPHWPSVGQLTLWLKVLRDSDGTRSAETEGLRSLRTA